MAQKLKNLRVTKVDFVDEGANPRADIKLYKRKEPENPITPVSVDDADLADSIMKRIADALAGVLKGKKNTIEKGEATSFKEKMNEVSTEKIREEIWSVCYALQSSLGSIVSDEELDASEMLNMLEESIEDFYTSIKGYAAVWASGEVSSIKKNFETPDETELSMLMQVHQGIGELIEKANTQKGELEEMLKIDKSKMTQEERAAYDDIIKKYAVEDEEDSVKKEKEDPEDKEDELEEEETAKKKKEDCKKSLNPSQEKEDIYKGLHPAVKAEMEALKKFKDEAEVRELTSIAKKYEVIGKKPEELVPTLKSLKAAGGTAYNDMIGLLDSMVDTVEQSGVFAEIGKSGEAGAGSEGETIAKVRAKAAEIKKSRPELTDAQAMDEAFLSDPTLLAEFDK